ncbi:unnamed protein product [Eruca vesicaria subsp. sativa]|uniref:FBD domain-containing protein n=1 Tax=Eruca vesicaria subsp. sativa TaxID=29727 RepID=A0ABC8K4Z9_ERUVS|nr:unnamed protein product [Eruca vesicaria subsp. sativa]
MVQDVYKSLLLHKAPFLERLYLNIEDPADIGILIGIAFSRHVRELVLFHYHEIRDDPVKFPSVLCSYNNTLHTLKLMYHIHLEFPSRVCLNALKKLHLHDVIFIDEASVCNLFSGCPRLQDLVVTRIKYPTGRVFYQLVSLELHVNELKVLNLWAMLEGSPKLQILKLTSFYPEYDSVEWEWNQPKCVPECLLFHLETFMWEDYEWERDEIQVATYILENARQLKKAIFSTTSIVLEEQEELGKRSELINELASVVRASPSCRLVFE